MSCNCNTKPTCKEQTNCTCPISDFPTSCILYTGDNLSCSNIDTNLPFNEVLQQLDDFICDKFDFAIEYFKLVNIGDGAKVYKGDNLSGQKQLRTIISSDTDLLDVEENDTTIGIRAGTPRLEFNSSTDVLTFLVNTISGDTTLSSIDLSELSTDTFLQAVSWNPTTFVATFQMNNIPNYTLDLSDLNNYLEFVTYNSNTNNIEFTLVDSTVITLNILSILQDVQIQSDFLEDDDTSPAFIQNKNAAKTVTLGVGGSYNVLNTDNNYVIEIDNGANNVTINLATITSTDNYFVGFMQKGTGTVSFINADTVQADYDPVIYGQGHQAGVEVVSSNKYLFGNLTRS